MFGGEGGCGVLCTYHMGGCGGGTGGTEAQIIVCVSILRAIGLQQTLCDFFARTFKRLYALQEEMHTPPPTSFLLRLLHQELLLNLRHWLHNYRYMLKIDTCKQVELVVTWRYSREKGCGWCSTCN